MSVFQCFLKAFCPKQPSSLAQHGSYSEKTHLDMFFWVFRHKKTQRCSFWLIFSAFAYTFWHWCKSYPCCERFTARLIAQASSTLEGHVTHDAKQQAKQQFCIHTAHKAAKQSTAPRSNKERKQNKEFFCKNCKSLKQIIINFNIKFLCSFFNSTKKTTKFSLTLLYTTFFF